MHKKHRLNTILLSIVIALLVAVLAYVIFSNFKKGSSENPKVEKTACTMDAKVCPDGSSVGRTGPKCEFICPEIKEKNDCILAGCYKNDCVDPALYLPPNCVAMPPTPAMEREFSCYKSTKCERQANKQCGWTETAELKACIYSARQEYDTQNISKGLKQAYSMFKNGDISECVQDGKTYYAGGINAYDGGSSTLDINGNVVGGCQGFTGKCDGIMPTKCERVYVVYPNIWGFPAVNKYNLK